MIDFSLMNTVDPYVRMMRLKRASVMSGKWKDIDNVFTYVAAGSADFIVEGTKYVLKTGNVIIIPPCSTHIIISHGKEPLVQYIMHFDFFKEEDRVALLHKDILMDEEYPVVISERERKMCPEVLIAEIPEAERNDLVRRYLNLLREFKERRSGRELMIKAECMGLLVSTFRNIRTGSVQEDGEQTRRSKSWILIENAVGFINRHEVKDMPDNKAIARAVGVTPNYLTRVFQEYLGVSLHRYVINLKVEKAQQYLLSGKVNVTEAARMSGFSSIHVMSKIFKKYLGISPSEFLDQSVNREI